jgi:hypothetical protein
MNVVKATRRYEEWLSGRLRLLAEDLALKHRQMRQGAFAFLRATYYRWAQTWEALCGDAARAPRVLAVADLHVENFGTWRDSEGRLIWGANDFDEAWPLPYTNDLIRLAASVLLARMACDARTAVGAILEGYTEGVARGGRPFVLAEHHAALRSMAVSRLHDPDAYWTKLRSFPAGEEPPPSALKAIQRLMPERGLETQIVHRIAGLGSLGRERYVAICEWRGGATAREAKALAPSACAWAAGEKSAPILYQRALDSAVRCPDPFVRVTRRWIVRRLAPDCSRIELSALPQQRDEQRLLYAMGFETANVHLGSIAPRALAADLKKRGPGWLYQAARRMEKAVTADFTEFRKARQTPAQFG